MNTLREFIEKINKTTPVTSNVLMKEHTTFKAGGPAQYYCKPETLRELTTVLNYADKYGINPFILGSGANILVSDKGINGLTIDMKGLNSIKKKRGSVIAEAGAEINTLCEFFLKKKLSGMEFLYGLPGTTGGAVWMNARCYGSSISDILEWVEYIDETLTLKRLYPENNFEYKKTPFQSNKWVIIRASFKSAKGKSEKIKEEMEKNLSDRKNKGHFSYPCAGSVFKNNRTFGKPSGQIIDSLGLKGFTKGDAKVADYHGNIIINTGNAQADDIKYLIDTIRTKVKNETGFNLEPEVLLVGNWDDNE